MGKVELIEFPFEDGTIKLSTTKKQLPIPVQLLGMRVSMVSQSVKVELETIGLTLLWDTHKLVTLEATAGLWNRTAGLCGTLDQNPQNDFMSKDRTVHKVS